MCEVNTRFVFSAFSSCFVRFFCAYSFPLCDYCRSAGVPAPVNPSGDKISLDQAMGDLGASVAQAREVLAKSTSTLAAVHKEVLPHDQLPANADGFLSVLGPGSSTSFTRALMVRGSESTFKLILAHEIIGDWAAAMSDLPRRPNRKAMSLKPIAQPAAQLAKTFMVTMDRIAAEAASRVTRGISESASEH